MLSRILSNTQPGNLLKKLSLAGKQGSKLRKKQKFNFSDLKFPTPREKIRNVAIIAHVDHGKTTLVDCLIKDSGFSYSGERIMDSIDLEKEKGITIMSKVTGVPYKDHFINIVDTPGHQDFGGEVERIMGMVDGVILVVCSTEGPMAQTTFVLRKALESNIKPLVVINKVDRESSRVEEVEDEIFELFLDLDEEEKHVENYDLFYASAKSGFAVPYGEDYEDITSGDTNCILDTIIKEIEGPKKKEDSIDEFSLLVSQIEYNKYHGKISRGKVASGSLKIGDEVSCYDQDGILVGEGVAKKIYKDVALNYIEAEEAGEGEIVNIAGLDVSQINHTICLQGEEYKTVIQSTDLDPPMIMVRLTANNSPKASLETEMNSSLSILASRLEMEAELDAALQAEVESDSIILKGRGDLHLGILFEKLRREGYEFQVTNPQVLKKEEDGYELEPVERVTIEVDDDYISKIIDRVLSRHGVVLGVENLDNNRQLLTLEVFSRALFGFRVEIQTLTSNTALYQSTLERWEEVPEELEPQKRGSLISTAFGKTTLYGMRDLEKLGTLFIGPSTEVYEGMIIGQSGNDQDWDVNPCKEKKLTNIRTQNVDETIRLNPPKIFNIEDAISFIRDDELLEITPKNVRMRKKALSKTERAVLKRQGRK